jgi:hypothetical protein
VKSTEGTSHSERLRIQNAHAHEIELHLEPWGEQLSISRNMRYEIVATGPDGDCLEVQFEEKRITIWGWSGSILSVFHEGDLLSQCNIPVPATPQRQEKQ